MHAAGSNTGFGIRKNSSGHARASGLRWFGVDNMTGSPIPSPTADFLVRLRKIDMHGLTHRDVIILYTIMKTPGSSGIEVADKIGLKNRSSVALNITRLIRCGFIEDRREMARKASPAVLHALPAGVAFWDEIKPE